jgi:hypothetical protein
MTDDDTDLRTALVRQRIDAMKQETALLAQQSAVIQGRILNVVEATFATSIPPSARLQPG